MMPIVSVDTTGAFVLRPVGLSFGTSIRCKSVSHGRDERNDAERHSVEQKKQGVSKRMVIDKIRLWVQKAAGDREGADEPDDEIHQGEQAHPPPA